LVILFHDSFKENLIWGINTSFFGGEVGDLFFGVFWDRVSLCNPGCTPNHDPPVSESECWDYRCVDELKEECWLHHFMRRKTSKFYIKWSFLLQIFVYAHTHTHTHRKILQKKFFWMYSSPVPQVKVILCLVTRTCIKAITVTI
jgi:hypothetical protein